MGARLPLTVLVLSNLLALPASALTVTLSQADLLSAVAVPDERCPALPAGRARRAGRAGQPLDSAA